MSAQSQEQRSSEAPARMAGPKNNPASATPALDDQERSWRLLLIGCFSCAGLMLSCGVLNWLTRILGL